MLRIGTTSRLNRPPSKRSNAAFTLIELLFVIFIIALVSRFAVPKFNELTTINLRSAARQVSGLINFTFNRAVMTKKQYRLTLNLQEGTYWVEEFVPPSPPPKKEGDDEELELNADDDKPPVPRGEFRKLDSYLSKPGRLPKGVKIAKYYDARNEMAYSENGVVYIYFYPIGETNGGYLILSTTEDTSITLRINPITGKVVSYRGVVENFNES